MSLFFIGLYFISFYFKLFICLLGLIGLFYIYNFYFELFVLNICNKFVYVFILIIMYLFSLYYKV